MVNTWVCKSCGLTNFLLNKACADSECRTKRPFKVESYSLAAELAWQSLGNFSRSDLERLTMHRDEELYKKFYNEGLALGVGTATIEELIEKIEELELISFEARVKAGALSEEKKKRVSKLSQEERDKLITQPDFQASDRSKLDLPRRARKTKADKLKESLSAFMTEEEVKALMANVKVKEPDIAPSSPTSPDRQMVDKPLKNGEASKKLESTAVNTQTALLNEYLNNGADKWKKATINLAILAESGMPEFMIANMKEEALQAENSLVEKYRTACMLARRAMKEQGIDYSEPVEKKTDDYNPFA